MGERKISFALTEFYHVYNRGNSKQVIYRNQEDYLRFLKLLKIANTSTSFKLKYITELDIRINHDLPLVAIGAYCLMPNHFHILLTPLVEGGVSLFMQKITTGYSMYFNSKYKRTGSLFEGKFRAQWINNDNHLKYLFSYIHLNPVKLIDPTWKEEGIKDGTKAFAFASSYDYSSLATHLSQERPVKIDIINTEPFPRYFKDSLSMQQELFEWIIYGSNLSQERPVNGTVPG